MERAVLQDRGVSLRLHVITNLEVTKDDNTLFSTIGVSVFVRFDDKDAHGR